MDDLSEAELKMLSLAQELTENLRKAENRRRASPEYKFGKAFKALIDATIDGQSSEEPRKHLPIGPLLHIARVVGIRRLHEASLELWDYQFSRAQRPNPKADNRRKQSTQAKLREHFVCGVLDLGRQGLNRPNALAQAAAKTSEFAKRGVFIGKVNTIEWLPPGSTRQLQRRFSKFAGEMKERGYITDPISDAINGIARPKFKVEELGARRGRKPKIATSKVT